MIKRILLIVVLIWIAGNIFSQDKDGTIKGIVYDKGDGQALESALIQLYKMNSEELMEGAVSDKNGAFSFNGLKGDIYKIKISFIGYNTINIKDIIIEKKRKEYDAGKIEMEVSSEVMREIEVTADAPMVENTLDKKVYNVENNPMNETGSALDILQHIPSVNVDDEGKLSLRGNPNVQILIDGKVPSGKDISDILDQLPANKIEKIEVLNNPSVKYDAEGSSGIINIITKKSAVYGYNVDVNLNAGTLDKYNVTGGFNYAGKKLKLYSGYSTKFITMEATSANNLEYTSPLSPFEIVTKNSKRRHQERTHIGSIGLDYQINKNNFLSIAGNYNYRWRKRIDNIITNSFDWNNILVTADNNYFADEDYSNNFDISGTHKLKFKNDKQELNTNFVYAGSWNRDVLNLNNLTTLANQINHRNDNFNTLAVQTDYFHPVNHDSHLEGGLKFNFRKINSDLRIETAGLNGNWLNSGSDNDNFLYKENILSAYSLYYNKIKDFKIQAGVRIEQSIIDAEESIGNISNYNNYIDIFPGASLSYQLTSTDELQISYSRRINRPGYRNLNPLTEYFDIQNVSKGNLYLKPEYVNSAEFSYIKFFQNVSLSSSVFYRETKNVINRITTATDSGFTYTTYENLSNSESYGIELILAGDLTKWWNINANLSYFGTKLIIGSIPGVSDNSNYVWNGKINSNIKIPQILEIQMSYNYLGKTITAQGYNEPVSSFDVSFKRNIIDKRLSINFKVLDLFNTLRYVYHVENDNFIQSSDRKKVSRTAFLSLTFRFGTADNGMGMKKKNEEKPNKDDED